MLLIKHSLRTALLVLSAILSVQLACAQSVTLYFVDQGWVGDTNYIEFRSTQFHNISAIQLSMGEENRLGTYIGIDRINIPNFSPASDVFYSNGSLRLVWNVPFINGFTVPDGQVLFRIKWLSDPSLKHCYKILPGPPVLEISNWQSFSLPTRTYSSCESFAAIPSFFNAFRDLNANCSFETQEPLFSTYTIVDSFNQQVRVYKNPQLIFYDPSDHGIHYFRIIPENPVWTACNEIQSIAIDSATKFISLTYGIQPLVSCPQLAVEINTPWVRRCVDYTYQVRYENKGTIAEDSAVILLKLDPYMIYRGSSITPSSVRPPYLEFKLGKLDVFQTGQFEMTVQLDCGTTVTGQTHCVTAEILPQKDCIPSSPSWSGASIELDARCEDGKAKFRIGNLGGQDMPEPTKYWIVEDDIMPGLKKDVQLDAGQFLDLEYPADGTTYRLMVDQVAHHPGSSNPTLALEACGRDGTGNFSTGFVLQFPEDEEDENIAVDCQQSRGSFDPNDKNAAPLGYGNKRFVEPLRSLEYKIRFQNVGTDTAFKVVIIDTLSAWMDLQTLKILDASHPFRFTLVNRVLSFTFDPIYLPYQSIDENGSNGYVTYSVRALANAPLGTAIENTADIFFDFNPAVTTNTTLHTLGKDYIVVSLNPADPDNNMVNIYPNPGTDYFIIEISNGSPELDLWLYDLFGRPLLNQKMNQPKTRLNLNGKLSSGTYLLYLTDVHGNSVYHARVTISTKD